MICFLFFVPKKKIKTNFSIIKVLYDSNQNTIEFIKDSLERDSFEKSPSIESMEAL